MKLEHYSIEILDLQVERKCIGILQLLGNLWFILVWKQKLFEDRFCPCFSAGLDQNCIWPKEIHLFH